MFSGWDEWISRASWGMKIMFSIVLNASSQQKFRVGKKSFAVESHWEKLDLSLKKKRICMWFSFRSRSRKLRYIALAARARDVYEQASRRVIIHFSPSAWITLDELLLVLNNIFFSLVGNSEQGESAAQEQPNDLTRGIFFPLLQIFNSSSSSTAHDCVSNVDWNCLLLCCLSDVALMGCIEWVRARDGLGSFVKSNSIKGN